MKINASFLKNLNPKAKTKKFSLVKTKKTVKIVSLSLTLLMMLGLTTGCEKSEQVEPTATEAITTSEVLEEGKGEEVVEASVEEEAFSLLADRLSVDGLTMTDDLTAKVEAEVQAQLDALNPGGTNYKPSDVYVAPDGSTWVSEDAYEDYKETGDSETTVVEDGYLAPDGNVWASEQDYLDYIAGNNGDSTPTIEGDYYQAPDGSIWSSQEEYEKYVSSNDGKTETPVEGGEVVEQGEGYLAPDGSYWTSEQDYLDYVAGSEENTDNNTNDNNNNTNDSETGTSSEDENDNVNNYYIAPDGSIWSSEADYLEYIKGMEVSTTSETTSYEEETDTVVVYDDNYYVAPNGTVWESEADYLAYTDSNSAEVGTGEKTVTDDTLQVEVVPESQYTETEEITVEDTSNYYQDEDGNWWASYEDYLLYKENESKLTK